MNNNTGMSALPPRKPTKSWSASSTIRFKQRNAETPTNRNTTLNKQSFNSLPYLPKPTNLDRPFFRKPSPSAKLAIDSTEHLHEQNTTLKQKINTLNTALGQQRTKVQITSKNFKRINEKMDTEFAEEIYFECLPNKNYLVEGVKCQYYRMKQKYEEKCKECETLMKKEGKGAMTELKVYCEAMEGQNRRLKDRLAKLLRIEEEMFGELQLQQHMEIATAGGVEATQQWKKQQECNIASLLGISAKLAILQEGERNAQRNLLRLQEKIEMQRKVLLQRKGKIDYLQRLVKRLSNEIHELQLKSFRQNKKSKEIIEELSEKIRREESLLQIAMEESRKKQMNKRQDQKEIYIRHLKEKQGEIDQLKREIKSLHTMIKTLRRELPLSTKRHKRQAQQKKKQDEPITHESDIDKFKFTFAKDSPNIWEEQPSPSVHSSCKEETQQLIQVRVPKCSYVKHSQDCIRVKPIKASQIQHLKNPMIAQLVSNKVSIDDIKQLFDFSPSSSSQADRQWKEQYISLLQIQQILARHPFKLADANALLLGRFMAEDCSKQDIYFHPDNQVERAVAKSIIRAFVGEDLLPNP